VDALAAFAARIDCRFPRHDLRASLRLVDEACGLPSEALLLVLYELQHRPRYGPRLRRDIARRLFAHVRRHARAPFVEELVQVVERTLAGYPLSLAAAERLLRRVAAHGHHHAALALIERAVAWADLPSIETACDALRAAWRAAPS